MTADERDIAATVRKDAEGLRPEQVSPGRALLGCSPLRHADNLEPALTYEGTSEMHLLSVGKALTGHVVFR